MNLVITSKFRPFTYDEMVKPLVQYKEAYDRVEQDYSDLVAQTEAWKDIANQENSPEAYAMYSEYSDRLNNAVESLNNGLDLGTRNKLIKMKRGYASSILPIARASEAMRAANELRIKAGSDAIFEVGEYNSLDPFLHGGVANNRYQSKEALTNKTAALTRAAMDEALKDPEFRKAIGDQFWMITQHTGGSRDDLIEAMKLGMMDNPITQNIFSQVRQEVLRKSGIQNYDAAGQQAIIDAVDTGLYTGLDKPTRSFQANADHITPVQAHNMRMQEIQLGLEGSNAPDRNNGSSGSGTGSDRVGMPQNILFFDIKHPNRDSIITDAVAVGEGQFIDYQRLMSEDDPYELNQTVKDKTGNDNATLKSVVNEKLKTIYPNADEESLENIANLYFNIKVMDNGNIYFIPKESVLPIGGARPQGTGINADMVVPAQEEPTPSDSIPSNSSADVFITGESPFNRRPWNT